jgi:hypothetical protein
MKNFVGKGRYPGEEHQEQKAVQQEKMAQPPPAAGPPEAAVEPGFCDKGFQDNGELAAEDSPQRPAQQDDEFSSGRGTISPLHPTPEPDTCHVNQADQEEEHEGKMDDPEQGFNVHGAPPSGGALAPAARSAL